MSTQPVTPICEALAFVTPAATSVHPAIEYLTALFRPDDLLCLTFIHPTKVDLKGNSITKNFFQPLSNIISERGIARLTKRNEEWQIYVSMATFKKGTRRRLREYISQVLHVFIEADGNGEEALEQVLAAVSRGEIPPPSIILRSSPHRYQFIWNVDGLTIESQQNLNKALMLKFGTDPSATDAARVLRIAGFKNLKPKYADPKPVAEIIEHNERVYTAADFKIPIVVNTPSSERIIASDETIQQKLDFLTDAMEAASVGYFKGHNWGGGGYLFALEKCPWCSEHTTGNGGACAIVQASGAYGFSCLHAHCHGKKWCDFRNYMEGRAGRALPFAPTPAAVKDEPSETQQTEVGSPERSPTKSESRVVDENEPAETVTPLIVPYPVFPYWVMEGTSIYTGLVEPECRANCKYEEFLFMPAFVHLLNYVMIRTRVERHTQTTGILLVNIGERGQALKSASCDLAFEYMFRVGLGKKFSRSLNPLDLQERSLIVTAGSPEGFLSKMANLNCLHGILYYDELSKLVSKASIESSSMVPDLCTMLESGEFSSITLKNSPVLNAGEYCVSVIANTPSKSFLHVWAQLHGNESTGLEDRAFFLLEPRTKKPRTPKTDVSFSGGERRTRERVDAAMARRVFPARDWQLFNDAIEHLGTRAEVRAEIFALGFAVDLGRDCIDDDCKRRGIALAEYDLATKHYLRPIEAETKQGAVQQEIIRTLEHAGGQTPYRELCQTMHSARLGSDVWDRAISGLEHGLTPRIKIVKGTSGRAGKPTMVYLLPETD